MNLQDKETIKKFVITVTCQSEILCIDNSSTIKSTVKHKITKNTRIKFKWCIN